MHQTTRCVTTKQRTLRSLQDFDSVDIKYGERLRLRHSDVAFIEVHGVGCLDDVIKIVLRDAANGELGVLSRQISRNVDAGRKSGDIEAL